MKTIDKEMSLFGDLYYNATRIEVANFAKGMKKYPMNAITSYLKLIMQDVLAHLAGSTSFIDACMVKDKLHFECMINNKIGKRKLVEFFALLEELDKQGIHMDELDFAKNNNDRFLEQLIKERRKGILQDYLAFNNLNDFFDMVMTISTIMPMAKRVEDFDVFIPNPVDFDFKSKYYDSIDYLAYYMDKEKHDSLMSKHEKNGSEVNLVQWIKNYKNRYAIKDILREEMGIETDGYDRSVASDNPIDNAFLEKIVDFAKSEYDFSADEIDYLRLILKEKNKEISILRSQIVEMRNSIKVILDHQDVKLSDGEIEKLEEEFISEAVIKHITKKPRVNKGVKVLIYSAIVASLVLIPTFGLLNNLNDGEKSYVGKKEPVRIEQEKEKQDEIKDEFQENLENEEQDLQIGVDLPEEDTFPKDSLAEEETWENDAYRTEFIIGESVSGNFPYYISSTSDEILGFLNDDVIIIGYFATLNGKNGMEVFRSCRNQEQIDKFLRLYHGDGKDIIWRAAVTKVSNDEVQAYLMNGEEIPYDLTTCYIDCEPAKELQKIRGK